MARVKKQYNGVNYILDDNFDYSNAIKEAESFGDYEYAASLERSRNAKIDGEGLSYAKTYKYQNGNGAAKASSGGYSSQYGGLIADKVKEALNREKFNYDYTKDDSYKALEAAYKANGKLAMEDTLGEAASLTGGRASSAAVSASQQAYNRYMQQLSENIPALEQAAYGRYRDEGNELYNQINLLQGLDNNEYSKFIDDREFSYRQERDAVGDAQWEKTFDYGVERDKISDERYEEETAYNRTQNAKNEAFTIAQLTGDYSSLLEYDFSPETVDALNNAAAEGKKKEEISEALTRAQYMAQYGDFSGFLQAGFTQEQVSAMEEYWRSGKLREDAILKAEFGDYSGLSELGIKVNIPTGGGGGSSAADTIYNDFVYDINNGITTYTDIITDPAFFTDVCKGDKDLANRITTYAYNAFKESKKNMDESNNERQYNAYVNAKTKIYDGASLESLGTANELINMMGLENYEKLREDAGESF